MLTMTFQIQVPQSLCQFGLTPMEIQRRINEWIVLSLFIEKRISSGKATQLFNINRVEFLSLLRKNGIIYISYFADELEEEIAAILALEVKITSWLLSRIPRL
jgi:predicted HTH domain antitoxin